MKNRKAFLGMAGVFTVIALVLISGAPAAAQTETVIFSFGSSPNDSYGSFPTSSVTFDSAGNLYSTTPGGGSYVEANGTVFELTPSSDGNWTPKVVADFGASLGHPNGGVIFDGVGNLYGVTTPGGTYNGGVAYELMPQAGGGWTQKLLHQFGQGTDGNVPVGNLVFDSAGNLYGVTVQGGTYGQGTVFELMPQAGGLWAEKVLHSFTNAGADGGEPQAGVILDSAGNLYGTTLYGGINRNRAGYAGVVFELSPGSGAAWTENILYSFIQSKFDGAGPAASLIFDTAGNLYGTTTSGGEYRGNGTVFELSPGAGRVWTEKILHSFNDNGTDGFQPYGNLIMDSTGSLYGTTDGGGRYSAGFVGGTVFKVTPGSGGTWTESIVHNFGDGDDGSYPLAGLVMDASGNLYSTTRLGGTGCSGGCGPGTVFEISQ
ncbi:MAG: choice-of-anchor tandem repeat GloVer-containing protein [Candidatus Sulfotelmatobacter sp.]